jgi:DNA-binding MarR family transcriptional regulator
MGTQSIADIDPARCNCLALRQATRHVSQIYDSHLAVVGLKSSQYSILAKLGRLGALTINELAKSMVMDRTTLGRAIRPLERDGLLTIVAGKDARTRRLRLTAEGEARLAAAIGQWQAAQDAFEQQFGDDDAAGLRKVLREVVERTR